MPPRKSKIRVLIADDHAILRAGLKMLVNTQADMEVVGEAADGERAVRAVEETKPDVALVDITMPLAGGMIALRTIVRDHQRTRLLVLTMHDDPAYLRSALAAGASGYVLKKSAHTELLAAIRAVYRGGTFVDPSLAGVLVEDLVDRTKANAGAVKLLSDRELQVLGLVARGYSSRQIAKHILVSVKSVETYRSRFAQKLGLKKRSEVVRFAIQLGLLTPETLGAGEDLPGQ